MTFLRSKCNRWVPPYSLLIQTLWSFWKPMEIFDKRAIVWLHSAGLAPKICISVMVFLIWLLKSDPGNPQKFEQAEKHQFWLDRSRKGKPACSLVRSLLTKHCQALLLLAQHSHFHNWEKPHVWTFTLLVLGHQNKSTLQHFGLLDRFSDNMSKVGEQVTFQIPRKDLFSK